MARCLRHLLQCKAEGTLITPTWPSESFWPFLFPEVGKRAAFIVDFKLIPNLGGIFAEGPLKRKLFSRDKVKSVLIVKLDGSRKGVVDLKYEMYIVVCLSRLLHDIILSLLTDLGTESSNMDPEDWSSLIWIYTVCQRRLRI